MAPAVKARPARPADWHTHLTHRPDRWTRPAPAHPGIRHRAPTKAAPAARATERRRPR